MNKSKERDFFDSPSMITYILIGLLGCVNNFITVFCYSKSYGKQGIYLDLLLIIIVFI